MPGKGPAVNILKPIVDLLFPETANENVSDIFGNTKKTSLELEAIKNYIQQSTLDNNELTNLYSDVYKLSETLHDKRYHYVDGASLPGVVKCINRNFDLSRRTREFFTYFKSHYNFSMQWAHLLSNISLSRKSHVISLCPGWFPLKLKWRCII